MARFLEKRAKNQDRGVCNFKRLVIEKLVQALLRKDSVVYKREPKIMSLDDAP